MGLNRETEMEVTNYGKWQALEIGQIVTVLVDGTKPNHTLVYELSVTALMNQVNDRRF